MTALRPTVARLLVLTDYETARPCHLLNQETIPWTVEEVRNYGHISGWRAAHGAIAGAVDALPWWRRALVRAGLPRH